MSRRPKRALPKSLRNRATKSQISSQTSSATIAEIVASTEQSAQTNISNSPVSPEPPTPPDNLAEISLESYAETSLLSLSQQNLVGVRPQPVSWLWQKRLPLGGMTLLDGDHGTGKSLLALEIAARVSSGTPMPDGTPTIRGGVVIITPHTDANTTRHQRLTAMGADLSRIEILSSVYEPETASHPSGYRPLSLPQDLPRLSEAIERVDARLIVLDPFIELLSCDRRWSEQRLAQLLADLNQDLMARNIACLLIRNCPVKGGRARPSFLERSDRFVTIAASCLQLSPDPMQPDRLLLTHALSRHAALTPTLLLQIQPHPKNPAIPHFTYPGTHALQARDLIAYHPDTLHRHLLSQHLLEIISSSSDPMHASSIYARSAHSSPCQIQRALKDLLNMDLIERPARSFYAKASATPTFPLNATAATASVPEPSTSLNVTAATTFIPEPATSFNTTAATASVPEPSTSLNATAATTSTSVGAELVPAPSLKVTAATTLRPTTSAQATQRARTGAYKKVKRRRAA
jgi:hypothetical protein